MNYKHVVVLALFLFTHLFSSASEIKEGSWIGKLHLPENNELPFNFEVDNNQEIVIKNGKERVEMNPLTFENDSLKIYFSSYPNYLIFKIDSLNENKLSGYFVNPDRKNHSRIALTAKFHESFGTVDLGDDYQNIDGNWQIAFNSNSSSEYPAIGKFEQSNHSISGTFLTETGDYRFLSGSIINNELKLSTFDGAHIFMFNATLQDDTLRGEFLSGNHWKTNWIGFKNEDFQLKNPDSLTYMVKDDFKFNFQTLEGKEYVYPNKKLQNKVVIVQILGTWCPNCMDETVFYNELYEEYNHLGLEIIGVAYETPLSFEEKVQRINRFTKNKEVSYTVLVGGQASKEATSKDFNMLNKISSFPTSIFINKYDEVVKIHTGFNGPGTGEIYTEYKMKTKELIEKLLQE
ncbi:TlpA family protein disulfide reductase [Brumimicrobium mesophilum]|uniref:TlpA family protein disulfide reductase n=1 Tax=Brumimicrobium mesophilum TaxID=392717 RepID=UPI000D13EC7B|nr:TlpA disulfide reductase family protein [Brumimicrobium mesophilum]